MVRNISENRHPSEWCSLLSLHLLQFIILICFPRNCFAFWWFILLSRSKIKCTKICTYERYVRKLMCSKKRPPTVVNLVFTVWLRVSSSEFEFEFMRGADGKTVSDVKTGHFGTSTSSWCASFFRLHTFSLGRVTFSTYGVVILIQQPHTVSKDQLIFTLNFNVLSCVWGCTNESPSPGGVWSFQQIYHKTNRNKLKSIFCCDFICAHKFRK